VFVFCLCNIKTGRAGGKTGVMKGLKYVMKPGRAFFVNVFGGIFARDITSISFPPKIVGYPS
jgi:hypothetical protein